MFGLCLCGSTRFDSSAIALISHTFSPSHLTRILSPPSPLLPHPTHRLPLQVIHTDGATANGRALSWLTHALKSGALADVASLIVYVAFQVGWGGYRLKLGGSVVSEKADFCLRI